MSTIVTCKELIQEVFECEGVVLRLKDTDYPLVSYRETFPNRLDDSKAVSILTARLSKILPGPKTWKVCYVNNQLIYNRRTLMGTVRKAKL